MKQIKIKQSQKGYTLIEVLLVIVLIGILLTIGLVSLNTEARFIENRNDTRKSHIRVLEGAITQYKLQTGSYPTGLDRTYREICDPDASSCIGFVDLKQFLVPNYLQAIPQDPKDTDSTGGAGYEVAIDTTTNTVSVRLKESLREGGVIIAVNDPLPAESTTTANSSLAATVPVVPPSPPPIVTNGLVLHLDAGNTASYPGTGTTWIDLSGNNNNGTLVNGVGYNSANGGSLVFDGVNDRVSTNFRPSGTRSYFIWIKYNIVNSLPNGYSVTGTQQANAFNYLGIANGGAFYYYAGTTGGTISSTILSANTWYQQGFVLFSDGSRKLYLNGIEIASQTGGLGNAATSEFSVGCVNANYWVNGNISIVTQYNRALTAQEIQQNFNATSGRFGL